MTPALLATFLDGMEIAITFWMFRRRLTRVLNASVFATVSFKLDSMLQRCTLSTRPPLACPTWHKLPE